MSLAELDERRANAGITIKELAEAADIDRMKLGYALAGLTESEAQRVERALTKLGRAPERRLRADDATVATAT